MGNLNRFLKKDEDINIAHDIFTTYFTKNAENILGYAANNNYGDTEFDVFTNNNNTILFLTGYNEQLNIDKLLDII